MNCEKSSKTEEKVRNSSFTNLKTEEFLKTTIGGFLSVSEAAAILNKDRKTIVGMCERGELTAIPKQYGDGVTYKIAQQSVALFLEQKRQIEAIRVAREEERKKQIQSHAPYVEGWVKAMNVGQIGKTGKYAKSTSTLYKTQMEKYLESYPLLTLQNVADYLAQFPDTNGKQMNIYRAVVSFAKYLIRQGALDKSFVKEFMEADFKPRPNKNPKRPVITDEEMIKLLNAGRDEMERCIIVLMLHTGVRAAECAAIRIPDIHFEKQELFIPKAKWNKQRKLGLHQNVIAAIQTYLKVRPDTEHDHLFMDINYNPLTRDGVYTRVFKSGDAVGVKVSPHMIRRWFATHHLLNGKSIREVQTAMGHSTPQMTLMYDRTSEQHVIEAMKNW